MTGTRPVPASGLTCHASCVVLDEDGVLIRGEAGSGKSRLCLALLEAADRAGRHARLVGDDRVRLSVRHGRLIARPHPALEGLIEIRGLGPRRLATAADAAVIRLVVDLERALPRLPCPCPETVEIAGLALPALRLERSHPHEYLIGQALRALRRGSVASQTHSAALSMGGAGTV